MAGKISLIAQLQDRLDRANLFLEEHGIEIDNLHELVRLGKAADKLQLYVHAALREALESTQRRDKSRKTRSKK